MWVEDGDWPWPHHPVHLERDDDGEPTGLLVVDDTVRHLAFQVRPLTVEAAREWCGGTVVMVNGGPAVVTAGGVAGLGDFILADSSGFITVPALDMPGRWRAAATRD